MCQVGKVLDKSFRLLLEFWAIFSFSFSYGIDATPWGIYSERNNKAKFRKNSRAIPHRTIIDMAYD